LANDEVWRWIRVRLTSNNVNPHHRTFANPDVHDHALSIREEVLRHCVGIVAGYRQGGERLLRKSRFGAWDDLVRQPLLWAGVKEDIGTAFDTNIEASPELGAHLALLTELYEKFPDKKLFGANDVIQKYGFSIALHPLKEALLALHAKDPNNDRSVGHVLAKACGRKVQVDGVTIGLQQRIINGLTRYWVEEVG